MATILCLETSTKNCSVSIAENGKLIALKEDGSSTYSHAENLNVFIEEVLKSSGKTFSDLEGVAISEGPGSYTGLRIGASSAKAMSYALEIPLLAVNTLEAMASSLMYGDSKTLLIPMIDARRMEVFCAGFAGTGKPIFETRAEILTVLSFPEASDFEKVLFFGDGAGKCAELFSDRNFDYVDNVLASAGGMPPLAELAFVSGRFEDTAYFEPYYLKDFVAGKKKKSAG